MSNDVNAPVKRQGMAIASLVLGILSVMCLGLFAGVPAIIFGHKAHGKARKDPEHYTGDGFAIAGFVMGYASIVTTLMIGAVLAGMLLPALAKAKERAQSIKCINNLKNVGLAFRIYATDNQDRFPFNRSADDDTRPGKRQKGALDDPVHVFQSLSNELSTPLVLVCPGDSSKSPAQSFAALSENNISYELEIGPDVTPNHPQELLARCPIHGHELYCDGSVQQVRGRR